MTALRRSIVALVAVFAAVFGLASSASARSATYNDQVSVDGQRFYLDCLNDGAGDIVDVSGTLHRLDHFTWNNSGGFSYTYHYNYQGVTALGEGTGTTYRVVSSGSASQAHRESGVNSGLTTTVNSTFHFVGKGQADDFYTVFRHHETFDANGEKTASPLRYVSAYCR